LSALVPTGGRFRLYGCKKNPHSRNGGGAESLLEYHQASTVVPQSAGTISESRNWMTRITEDADNLERKTVQE
jgi:hypothetical protein